MTSNFIIDDFDADEISGLMALIELLSSKTLGLETRVTALEKIGNMYPPNRFVIEKYPLDTIRELFSNAVQSSHVEEIVAGLCYFPEIDNITARNECLKFLNHKDLEVRAEAVCALGYCAFEEDVDLLERFLKTEVEPVVKSEVIVSILRTDPSRADFFMTTYLLSQNHCVALEQLILGLSTLIGTINFSHFIEKIKRLIEPSSSTELQEEINDLVMLHSRQDKLDTIISLEPKDQIEQEKLLFFLDDKDQHVRFSALSRFDAMESSGEEILSQPISSILDTAIKEMLSDESADIRALAVSVISRWKRKSDISFFVNCLDDKEQIVRLDAIYALGEFQSSDALHYLKNIERSQITTLEHVRLLQAFLRCGLSQCFSEWIKYLDHKNAMIRANVAGGVWTILSSSNWKELQKHLVAAQKEEPYRYVYEEISDALAFIASKESDYRGP